MCIAGEACSGRGESRCKAPDAGGSVRQPLWLKQHELEGGEEI